MNFESRTVDDVMSDQLLQIQGVDSKDGELPRPPWIRVRLSANDKVEETRALMRSLKLTTVCEEAACPNLSECWADRHETVMILGSAWDRSRVGWQGLAEFHSCFGIVLGWLLKHA